MQASNVKVQLELNGSKQGLPLQAAGLQPPPNQCYLIVIAKMPIA